MIVWGLASYYLAVAITLFGVLTMARYAAGTLTAGLAIRDFGAAFAWPVLVVMVARELRAQVAAKDS